MSMIPAGSEPIPVIQRLLRGIFILDFYSSHTYHNMQRNIRSAVIALVCIIFLSACHSLPEHTRYIPGDASMVVGVNIKEIGKSLTWSAIKGSKLLDEMKEKAKDAKGKSMIDGIENSGIDWMNTVYIYTKPDKRFLGDTKTSLVAPLSDAKEWETYLKKIYPEIVIKKVKDRSEVMLEDKIYASWNSEVLMVMNTVTQDVQHEEKAALPETTTSDTALSAAIADAANEMPAYKWTEKLTDTAASLAEMEASFNIAKEASIIDNQRFKDIQKENNDISVYMSYDAVMSNLGQDKGMMAGMGAMLMNSSIWKNAAMTTAINFEDGKIVADMKYFPSDSLKSIAKEAGKENIDKDMLARIPAQKLNFAMGYHLAPQILKMMLDRLNLTGMANMALTEAGTNVDEILGAFTGDMTLSLNEFAVNKVTITPDNSMSALPGEPQVQPYEDYKPQMSVLFAIKVKDKAKLDKLLAMVQKQTGVAPAANGTYQFPLSGQDSVNILINDKYIIVANKMAAAVAYQGNNSGSASDVISKEIAGHPVGMYFDISSVLSTVDPGMIGGKKDAAMMNDVKSLLSGLKMNGGEFKGDANVYHAELVFTNKTENSLIQLLNFAQRMAALQKDKSVAQR